MIIGNLIYILQQENYDVRRFLRFIYRNLDWYKLAKRNKLTITPKSILLFALTVFLFLALVLTILRSEIYWLLMSLWLTLAYFSLPLIISFSLIFIFPIDQFFKKRKIKKAGKILETCDKLKVIGITGSFGKTTLKNILEYILREKYSVVKTKGNINTDIGVAEFIIANRNLLKKADFFIVEMGAYKPGEIKKLAQMVQPDYSFLTGIGTSHLERFGSVENIIKTKFELMEHTKQRSFLNANNKYTLKGYRKFHPKKCQLVVKKEVENIQKLSDFQGLKFKYRKNVFRTKLLAEHNIELFILAIDFAEQIGLEMERIKKGIENVLPIKHRLQPIFNHNTNIWVIDDSYNGNYNGFLGGIDVISKYQGRKIVLTPGIVEQGKISKKIHQKIGRKYAQSVDLVLLIDNLATRFIIKGMKAGGFRNFKIYKNTIDAHEDLQNVLQSGDVILFQNDLSDNY